MPAVDPGGAPVVVVAPPNPENVRLAEPSGAANLPPLVPQDTQPWYFPAPTTPPSVPFGPNVDVAVQAAAPAFLRGADFQVPAHAQPAIEAPGGAAPLAVGSGRGTTLILPGAARIGSPSPTYSLGGIARVLEHGRLVGRLPHKVRAPLTP